MSNFEDNKILVILRHENSIAAVDQYIRDTEIGTTIPVVLDCIQLKDNAPKALDMLKQQLQPNNDVRAVIVGTKVYDSTIDDGAEFPAFLTFLHNAGLTGDTPVIATHLGPLQPYLASLKQADFNTVVAEYTHGELYLVGDDNIGRDGMKNLGPVLQNALRRS